MIESVAVRHQGAYNFEDHYDNLCALQDCAPVPAVKSHLAQGVIDLNGDRVRLNDWQPIINSIRINKSLQFIAIRSYYQVPEEEDEKRAAILRKKLPAIRSKEITHRLIKALKDCLFVSPCLSCIELQGLSLRDRDLQVLVKGILKSQTLRHLSLEFCRIGDRGLEVLCIGLKNSQHINSVNLSGCSLSYRGAESLAAVIKHQGMQRHNEAWRDSLRYRRPDLDRMSGLRRITANANPMLGDEGAAAFAEVLKDDLWLKALDLQACGIGAEGATSFLEVLKYNTTLVVLDLRRNPLIERDLMHSVMEQLMLNSNGEEGEQYKWMSENTQDKAVPPKPQTAVTRMRRRATRVLNSSLGKKTTIKGRYGNNSCSYCDWVTPTTNKRRSRGSRRVEVAPSPGLPWRTAARANRFRGHPPDQARHQADQSSDTSALYTRGITADDDDDEDESTCADVLVRVDALTSEPGRYNGRTGPAPARNRASSDGMGGSGQARTRLSDEGLMREIEDTHRALDLTNEKEVRIELDSMRRHLREERLARAKSDQKIVQLMIQNRHLTEEVGRLKKAQELAALAGDESFLSSVEASFKQFHNFIDMLRDAGMGQLVTIAGLDTTTMPFGSNNNSSPEQVSDSDYQQRNNSNSNNHGSSSNGFSTGDGGPMYANVGDSAVSIQDSTYVNLPVNTAHSPVNTAHSRLYRQESDAARQEADDVYVRLAGDLGARHGGVSHSGGVAVPTSSVETPTPIAKALAEVGSPLRQQGLEAESQDEREEEPSSSQALSGRGQDDRRAGPLHDISAQDIESADEDF